MHRVSWVVFATPFAQPTVSSFPAQWGGFHVGVKKLYMNDFMDILPATVMVLARHCWLHVAD